MSDWNGPALYRIETGIKRTSRVSLASGSSANGTKVHMWYVPCPKSHHSIADTNSRNNDVNNNDVFAITYAGIGKSGKHEYHIINNNSGTFLTYPEGAPNGKQLTGEVMSPSNDRTRWSVRHYFPHRRYSMSPY
jgi:hypothetical protein